MLKYIFLTLFLLTNVNAFSIKKKKKNEAFDYFASLELWLLIISSPVYLLLSLIKYVKRTS